MAKQLNANQSSELKAQLFALDRQLVWLVDARQIPEARRERAQALQTYFGPVAEGLSPWIVLLEAEADAFSLARLRQGQVDLTPRALEGAQMALYFAALAIREVPSALRLLQNDAKLRVQATTSQLHRVSWDANLRKLLPSGQSLHRITVPQSNKSIDVSVVDAGEPVLLVRADELRSASKSKKGMVPIAGFDAGHIAQSLGLDLGLSSNFTLCWVQAPKQSEATANVDCFVQGCRGGSGDGLASEVLSAAARLSLAAAAAIPGTVLQQMVRALPGVDARIGLDDGVLVACAEVTAANDWTLKTLSIQQNVKLVMSVALQELS